MTELTALRKSVACRRGSMRKGASKITYVRRGTHNIYAPRICAICGRTLAVRDAIDGKYEATFSHYRLAFSGLLTAEYCANSENCVSRLNSQKVGDNYGTS